MKIFIDIDNTILEHSHFYTKSTENRTHTAIAKHIKINEKAIKTMYDSAIVLFPDSIQRLLKEDNVYLLTKSPSKEFDCYKREKMSAVLEISLEELDNMKDKSGNFKYIAVPMEENKFEYVANIFKEDTTNYILVDDYSENIKNWELHGGVGIKFYNEYNTPLHPNIGLTITNFKILEQFVNKKEVEKVFIRHDNSLNIDQEVRIIIEDCLKINKIVNVDKVIYVESMDRMQLTSENKKYDYLNFIIEYYRLIDNLYPKYWDNFWKEYLDIQEKVVFKSTFSVDVKDLFTKYLKDEEYLLIEILNDNTKYKSDYDLFITLEKDKHYIEGAEQLKKVKKTLSLLLGKDE